MKIKSLFIILITIGISASIYVTQKTKIVTDYSSRMNQESMMSPEGRDAIYNALKSNIKTGKIEPQDYLEMKKSVAKYASASSQNKNINHQWIELGPDNFGGRTRAILPVGENTVYAGSISGGLWKSLDQGNTWNKVVSPFRIVGSIAQAGNGDIYVGTGSVFEGGGGNGSSGFMGEGLFRSTDGGESWTIVEGTEPNFMSDNDSWAYINALSTDPGHENRVWYAAKSGIGYVENGVLTTVNVGIGNNVSAQDIEVSSDGNTILATVLQGGSVKVKISKDGGQSFANASDGTDLPSGSQRRGRVAISPSDPDFLYVAYAKNSGAFGGLWQSQDGGDSWTELWPYGIEYLNCTGTQGIYDLALAVNPFAPEEVFVGGLTVWKGGSEIYEEQISFYFGLGDLYVHPDIHEIVFSESGRMYIGCDGGVYGSANLGQTFFELNRGYNTQTFYKIANSSALNKVLGGAQDNGTIYIPGDGSLPTLQSGLPASGGDGFGCEISLVTEGATVAFVTSQNNSLGRINVSAAAPPSPFYDNNITNFTGLSDGNGLPFHTDIALFEDTEDEDSQQTIELVNPYDYDLFDADLTDDTPVQLLVHTNNKNIPFMYTLEDTLHYWATIERPELTTLEPLTQDPNYWWLNPQPFDTIYNVCVVDTTEIIIDTIIGSINPIEFCDTTYFTDTIFFQGDSIPVDTFFINCITLGYDTIFVPDTTFITETICHDEYHYFADVVENVREHKLIQDPYTSLFALGFAGDDGIWVTREALNFNVSPSWMRIVDNAPGSGTKALTFSTDGDRLYYTGWGTSSVKVVSNLDQLYKAGDNGYTGGDIDNLEISTVLPSAGGQITGIACDYHNPNHMVVSVGQYGQVSNGKVQETWNALDANPSWSNIWIPNNSPDPNLAKMPCYDVIIDREDETGATIIVGTEFGIFATENGGDSWATEVNDPADPSTSTGIDRTPVFDLRQQVVLGKRWWHPENTGSIYAGTHGRGIFRSDATLDPAVGIDEASASKDSNVLSIYPNPTNALATIEFTLSQNQDVIINVFSIQGELVKTITKDNLTKGDKTLKLDVKDLPIGNYILQLDAGNSSKVGKFVIMR